MTQNIYREIRAGIESGDRERTVEAATELLDATERDRARVSALKKLAKAARNDAGGRLPVATDVIETGARVGEAKIAVNDALVGYLRGKSAEPVVAELTDAIEAHNQFDDAVAELKSELEDGDTETGTSVFVTPVAADQFIVPKGSELTGELTVRNDTTTAAENISVAIQTEAAVGLESDAIETIPAGSTATVAFGGTPDAGKYKTEFTATVEGRSESTTSYVLVQDKQDYLERALNDLVEWFENVAIAAGRVTDSSGTGNGGNGEGNGGGDGTVVPTGIQNKTERVAERTVTLIDEVAGLANAGSGGRGSKGTPRAIDNKIGSVINEIEALQNQIEAQSGKGLDADSVPQLLRDADSVTEFYEKAQEADI